MMVDLFSLLTCVVIGVIVAAIERRSHEGKEITAVAAAGAVTGMYIGRVLESDVALGRLGGVICSAAGAVVLVRLYRSWTAGRPARRPSARTSTVSPDAADPPRSLTDLVAEAYGWGLACAFLTVPTGLLARLLGSHLYPQRYEQIPRDLFFVPLGMLLGFVAAAVARFAARRWRARAMASFIGLVSIVYAGGMFQYARVNSLPARITAIIEPEVPDPIACSPDTCEATDPPTQWYVTGRLRLEETRGLGATVSRIEIQSETLPMRRVTAHPYRRKQIAAEAARWRGPRLILSGRQVPGPRRLRPNGEVTYPLVYAYHTQEGTSRRQIHIYVHLTDDAGHSVNATADWKVR